MWYVVEIVIFGNEIPCWDA